MNQKWQEYNLFVNPECMQVECMFIVLYICLQSPCLFNLHRIRRAKTPDH